MNRRKELLEELLLGPRIEEPPSPLSKMFLQDKNSPKQKDSGFNPKKVTKNNKIGKNTNEIRGKLSGNDLV